MNALPKTFGEAIAVAISLLALILWLQSYMSR